MIYYVVLALALPVDIYIYINICSSLACNFHAICNFDDDHVCGPPLAPRCWWLRSVEVGATRSRSALRPQTSSRLSRGAPIATATSVAVRVRRVHGPIAARKRVLMPMRGRRAARCAFLSRSRTERAERAGRACVSASEMTSVRGADGARGRRGRQRGEGGRGA